MEILHPFLLVFIGLMGSFAKENLQRKSFIFPVKSNTAHVVAKGMPQHPFINVSMCLTYFTQLTRPYSLVSGATRKNDNEFLLHKPAPNQYSFYVGGDSVSFTVPETLSKKHGGEHICVIWESATGIVEFWVDGNPLPRKGLKKGSSINAELSLILGQEQDSYGGGFDANQSFEGEISDFYIWDRVLSPKEMAEVGNDRVSSPSPNPVIDWKSLDYESKGYVVIKPSLSPWYYSD